MRITCFLWLAILAVGFVAGVWLDSKPAWQNLSSVAPVDGPCIPEPAGSGAARKEFDLPGTIILCVWFVVVCALMASWPDTERVDPDPRGGRYRAEMRRRVMGE